MLVSLATSSFNKYGHPHKMNVNALIRQTTMLSDSSL